MEAIKSFIKTTLMGGMLVVLPIVILLLVFKWFYEFIEDKLKPITHLILETAKMQEFVASVLAFVVIIIIFFFVGLLIRTKFGRFTFELFDKIVLSKIPFYKLIKETITQLMSSNKKLFKNVAIVKLYGSDTLVTAFVTEEHDNGYYTVFVPSGPAPTAGFIYHLKAENVKIIDYPTEKAMKTIFSLGAGSGELLKHYQADKN